MEVDSEQLPFVDLYLDDVCDQIEEWYACLSLMDDERDQAYARSEIYRLECILGAYSIQEGQKYG